MVEFWQLNGSDGITYSLVLTSDEKWQIKTLDGRICLTYFDKVKKWIGQKDGHMIAFDWPTFRDIVERYISN